MCEVPFYKKSKQFFYIAGKLVYPTCLCYKRSISSQASDIDATESIPTANQKLRSKEGSMVRCDNNECKYEMVPLWLFETHYCSKGKVALS